MNLLVKIKNLTTNNPPVGNENTHLRFQHHHQRIINECYRSMTKSSTFSPNFSFGIDQNTHNQQRPNFPPVYFGYEQPRFEPVYNNCTFNINTPSPSITPTKNSRKRVIIESDSEYSQE